jgi:hypothetical protein
LFFFDLASISSIKHIALSALRQSKCPFFIIDSNRCEANENPVLLAHRLAFSGELAGGLWGSGCEIEVRLCYFFSFLAMIK